MMLEATCHERSSFVTLTYAPAHLPSDGSVSPRALKLFLMRYRRYSARPFRYFGVGEYGDRSWRPHYHLAMFGTFDPEMVVKCWPFGFCKTGLLTSQSAHYVAGYVTKKMTGTKDSRLEGRHPEFARMSNRPGIGANALGGFADFVNSLVGVDRYVATGDVPRFFRWDGQVWPVGRYLTERLRLEAGYGKETPEAYKKALAALRACDGKDRVWDIGRRVFVCPENEVKRDMITARTVFRSQLKERKTL